MPSSVPAVLAELLLCNERARREEVEVAFERTGEPARLGTTRTAPCAPASTISLAVELESKVKWSRVKLPGGKVTATGSPAAAAERT